MSTQNAPEEVHVVRAPGRRTERTCLKPFLTAENNNNRLVMMNHLAQESRSGSVLAERRALGICTEMGWYRGGYV
jgi:cob(I)alamin adenosyltransferase